MSAEVAQDAPQSPETEPNKQESDTTATTEPAKDDADATTESGNKDAKDENETKTQTQTETQSQLPYNFLITDSVTTTTTETLVLYEVSFICSKTNYEWKQYYRYSELRQFHLNLVTKTQQNKYDMPPEFAPRKRFSFSRTSKGFVDERLKALNNYFKSLEAYLAKYPKIATFFEETFDFSLSRFVKAPDMDMIEYLLSKENSTDLINKQDRSGATALHYGISFRNVPIVEKLLNTCKDSISVTINDSHGWNALSLSHYLSETNDSNENETESVTNSKKIAQLLATHFNETQSNEENKENKENKENNMSLEDYTQNYPKLVRIPIHYIKNFEIEKRHFLVFVNPASGKGKGPQIWSSFLQTIFDKSKNVTYDAITTTKAGHATEICQKLDLKKYDTIVAIGGDGTLAEVLNGLFNHKDSENALNIPVCGIPAGSGNAIGVELASDEANKVDIYECCRRLLDGIYMSFDTYTVSQENEIDLIAFVSTQWGIISSVDLESENMRWMGSVRFDLKAVSQILAKAHYHARIYYKPLNEQDYQTWKEKYDKIQTQTKEKEQTETENKENKENTEKNDTTESKTDENNTEKTDKTEENETDKTDTDVATTKDKEKDTENAATTETETETTEKKEDKDTTETTEAAADVKSDDWEKIEKTEIPDASDLTEENKLVNPESKSNDNENENERDWWRDLPKNKDKFPEGWCMEEDELGLMCVDNIGSISEGFIMGGSDLKVNDHSLKVIWSTKVTRTEGFRILLAIEDGSHLQNPNVFQCRCDEAVIEPLADHPPIDVDGERRPVKPTYIKLLPGRCLLAC